MSKEVLELSSSSSAQSIPCGVEKILLEDYSILEPFTYISQVPGKDVRGILIDCFQTWLNIPREMVDKIKTIISYLHNSSLLIDDIEDNSKLRRGVPVAHSIYGTPSTINCANYVYFMALSECHQLNNPKAMEVFVSEMLNLHRGQGYDIMWRDQCHCPTEEEYRAMVLNKTGGLFRLSVGLMQAFSESTTNFTTLLNALGLYFQIRDDFVNISSAAYMLSKSFCEDLTEGKFSFPIIHAIHACPNDSRLLNILRQRSEDENIKRHAVQWMTQCGSISYTRDVLKELKNEVMTEIEKLGGNSVLVKLIGKLDDQLDEDCTDQLAKTNKRIEIVTTL